MHTKDSIQKLLRRVLQEYWDEDGFIDGIVKYCIPQVQNTMSEFLEKDSNSKTNWIIKDNVKMGNTYPNSYSVKLKDLYDDAIASLTNEYGATPVAVKDLSERKSYDQELPGIPRDNHGRLMGRNQ